LMTSLLMTFLTIGALGCGTKTVIVKPPLPPKPHLSSLEKIEHPKTNEPGWWMNDPDMRGLIKAWEGVEAIRDHWR